jgi:hypothetical protein
LFATTQGTWTHEEKQQQQAPTSAFAAGSSNSATQHQQHFSTAPHIRSTGDGPFFVQDPIYSQ